MYWVLFFALMQAQDERPSPGRPEAVVQRLYAQIVKSRPLGIPTEADRAVLWPLLTPRLAGILVTAERCQEDYFRQHPDPDLKPEFGWLEVGLFSGPDEMALPSEVNVVGTDALTRGRHVVHVEFTYRDSIFGRAGDPDYTFRWRGEVIVEQGTRGFLVDDFRRIDAASNKRLRALSQQFVGCRGTRWVGYRRK